MAYTFRERDVTSPYKAISQAADIPATALRYGKAGAQVGSVIDQIKAAERNREKFIQLKTQAIREIEKAVEKEQKPRADAIISQFRNAQNLRQLGLVSRSFDVELETQARAKAAGLKNVPRMIPSLYSVEGGYEDYMKRVDALIKGKSAQEQQETENRLAERRAAATEKQAEAAMLRAKRPLAGQVEKPEDIQKRLDKERTRIGEDVKKAETQKVQSVTPDMTDQEKEQAQDEQRRKQEVITKMKLAETYIKQGMGYWDARDKAEEEINQKIQSGFFDYRLAMTPERKPPEEFLQERARVATTTKPSRPPLSSFRKASITGR